MGVGAIFIVWSMFAADSLRGFYRAWMRVAMVIGTIVNTIVLAVVFYLVITPMGLVMKLAGKDPMRRKFDPSASSYRIISKVADKNHVERPF